MDTTRGNKSFNSLSLMANKHVCLCCLALQYKMVEEISFRFILLSVDQAKANVHKVTEARACDRRPCPAMHGTAPEENPVGIGVQ